jgi:hypothetical protein
MSALEARAETAKLARLLSVDPDELGYLIKASPDDVRAFREQVTDVLFERDRARFGRLAAGSRVIPAQLSALIAERTLGPVLCARLAGLIDPAKAIEISKRLPAPFLAAVAIEMDPRRAKDVIARVPAELVATVARELADQHEYVTMGRFVAYLGDDALKAAITGMDDVTLLQTAFVMEGKERLDAILSLLPGERLRTLTTAAEQHRLWEETLDLLAHVGPARVEQIAADIDSDSLHGLAEAVRSDGLWPPLLATAERMSPAQLDRIAQRLLGEGFENELPGLIAAVDASGRWETGLRMLAGLPPGSKTELAPVAATLNGDERKRVLEQAEAHGLLGELGPIADALKH